jgi:serine/threonine protein kinase
MTAPPTAIDHGRFQVYDPIGTGAVATVYRAYDRNRNAMCALKLLNEDSADNAKRRARFLSEAETLQALAHPHIVPVWAAGEHEGRLWIAMELMSGGSAGRKLKLAGPLPANQALDICEKVLRGLEAAHQHGVVHRDVKPQNILLGDDGAVKLCDFGIARTEKATADDEPGGDEALTQMFDRLGSIIYMAPEQRADARDVTPATDLYAVGATLFALLSSRRPPDLSRAAIRPKMLDVIAPPLRPLLLRACDLDPKSRYATAAQMADEVARLRDDARRNPRWYEAPITRPRGPDQDEFAQWPDRPAEKTPSPTSPRAVYRPERPAEPAPPPADAPPGPPARGATPTPPPRAATPAPAPPARSAPPPRAIAARGSEGPSGVPWWVWGVVVAVGAAALFAVGVIGGLAVVWWLRAG